MTHILGVVRRDGAPVEASTIAVMLEETVPSAPRARGEWVQGAAALGQVPLRSAPASEFEAPALYERDGGFAFAATARLDNREELVRELGPDRTGGLWEAGDRELLLAAYRRWGESAPARVFGDWAFAAWHPGERRLVLARDHFGHTALYYYADADVFAFASSPQPLRKLGLAPPALDELYLAQQLISWTAYHGERTIDRSIRRLPPAHVLTLSPERLDVHCYWRMEEASELRLAHRSDYVDAFCQVFDRAVRTRIPPGRDVGVTLSGGLDSGAVAATAALALKRRSGRLPAFTWVPFTDTTAFTGARFGNELPFASATAAAAGNVDLQTFTSERISPIQGIRRALEIFGESMHTASNAFWILDLLELASTSGCNVLLTGQLGNAVISWTGDPLSQPLAYQLHALGARRWAKARVKRALPPPLLVRHARRRINPGWHRGTAIHPDFARRLHLAERRLADPETFPATPLQERLRILKPGRTLIGALWAQFGAAFGVAVSDPTSDVRLIEFALSVPDRVFIDPVTGLDRWLIRESMRDRLPDAVRLNRVKGIQAGDLVPRLRACHGEVEDALDELAAGPAADYLDLPYMRTVWQTIQRENTPEALRKADTVLTRGIMAGLSVNSLDQDATAHRRPANR